MKLGREEKRDVLRALATADNAKRNGLDGVAEDEHRRQNDLPFGRQRVVRRRVDAAERGWRERRGRVRVAAEKRRFCRSY